MTYMISIPEQFKCKCHTIHCDDHPSLYRYPELEEEKQTLSVFLCDKCAAKEGFCHGCGLFWGGNESFEYGKGSRLGLCPQCFEAMCDDVIDYDEDNDDFEW